ncbi:MAG: hypothetical protein J6A38_01145 [Clostridia bacterium]|nr:hypothetical protein [Clostridia bacterium]
MNYIKKMCILRQIKQGFSGDGKTLSGLIKIEQYGKNLAVEVSVINFAPLVSGDYYCLLSDGKGKTEMLCLRGKSLFNLLSDLDVSDGFCGIICYVKNEVVPIAYGINGNGSYDWKSILNATLPPVFPRVHHESATAESTETAETAPPVLEKPKNDPPAPSYNDESVATENYYEVKHERELFSETKQNARTQGTTKKSDEKERADATENGDAENVLHPFKTQSDGYYVSVKSEIDELFANYPKDDTLQDAFGCGEWVRVKGTAEKPEYLVGVLYQDGKAQYVCYALSAKDPQNPPEEIKNVCAFVPTSVFDDTQGFFVIFQSASTGECIQPERI